MSAFSLSAYRYSTTLCLLILAASVAAAQSTPAPPANSPPNAIRKLTPEDMLRISRINLLVSTQSKSILQAFIDGPHVGPVEQAVVGVEVINKAKDGTSETRTSSGLLLRCDGFYLMPASQTSHVMSTGQEAEQQKIYVTLHAGTPQAQRLLSYPRRLLKNGIDMMALKLQNAHAPAARTLLPDMLKPGDEVEVVWTNWNAQTGRFSAVQRRKAHLAEPPKDGTATKQSDIKPGEIRFTESLEGVPGGAIVIGPEGRAVGLLPASQQRHDRFLSFSVLDRVTNCVVPDPITDAEFALRQKKGEPEDGSTNNPANGNDPPAVQANNGDEAQGEAKPGGHLVNDMVEIPGGPVKLPLELMRNQDDMNTQIIACVPPFKLDRYKVSNREYYAFWKSVPEKERKKKEVRAALYPIAWADADPPFPAELDNVPVLGVPLSGAQAFARSQGKRLPTPYEWTRAAFGPLGDAAAPDWALRYMLDRQQTWKRLVLNQYAYLTQLSQEPMRRRQMVNIDIAARSFADRAKNNLNPLSIFNLADRSPIPYISTDEALTEACRWSYQQVMAEVQRLDKEWKDPLYVIPSGSRPFDTSPYGVMDMLLNGNELVAASPEPAQHGGPEYVHVRWIAGIADPQMFGQALDKMNQDWYTNQAIYMNENMLKSLPASPLLSRRLASSGSQVHSNSNEFSPSWYEAWIELASRFYETYLMLYPINSLAVEPEWVNAFKFDNYGEGTLEFSGAGAYTGHHIANFEGGGALTFPKMPSIREGLTGPLMDVGLNTRYLNKITLSNRIPVPGILSGTGEPRLDEVFGVVYGDYFSETPYYTEWAGASPFMRQEMGRDWARDPHIHFGAGPLSSQTMIQPADIYLVPNGFRCAR